MRRTAVEALLDRSEFDLNRAVDRFAADQDRWLQSERERRALAKLAEAEIAFDPKCPPDEGSNEWFYWREVKRIQKGRKTLDSEERRESGLAYGREDRCRVCGTVCKFRLWKYDVLELNAELTAQHPKSRVAWRSRRIQALLNARAAKPLKERAIRGALYDAKLRAAWLDNRAAYQARPSHAETNTP